MALVDQFGWMVMAGSESLEGGESVDACRRAVRGGAPRSRSGSRTPRRAPCCSRWPVASARCRFRARERPRGRRHRRRGRGGAPRPGRPAAGALRGTSARAFCLASRSAPPRKPAARALLAHGLLERRPLLRHHHKTDAGPPLGPGGFAAALARLAPPGVPVIGIGGITAETPARSSPPGATGVAVIGGTGKLTTLRPPPARFGSAYA